MNKRLERVETSKKILAKIYSELHDAVYEGPDVLLVLKDGKCFFVQGFTTRDSFERAFKNIEDKDRAKK